MILQDISSPLESAAAFREGRFEEAEHLNRYGLRLDPGSLVLLQLQAGIMLRTDRAADALAPARRAVWIDERNAVAWNTLGVVLRALGRSGEAATCYQRSIALAPGTSDYHANLGNALADGRDWLGAAMAYRDALRCDANHQAALQRVAVILRQALETAAGHYNDGRVVEALPLAEGVLELQPENGDALHIVARCATTLGDLDRADRAAGCLLALEPQGKRAWQTLAHLRRVQSRRPEARLALSQVTRIEPDKPAGWIDLANFLLDGDRLQDAADMARQAVRAAPEAVEPLACLAVIHQKANDLDTAGAVLKQAMALGRPPAIDTLMVTTLSVMGQLGEFDAAAPMVAALERLLDEAKSAREGQSGVQGGRLPVDSH